MGVPGGQLPRSPSRALESSRIRGGGNCWQVMEGAPLEMGRGRGRRPLVFTHGGSGPGGVASTHACQAVMLCTDPHLRVQRTATPTLRPPLHTLKCESTSTHRSRTPSQAAPWSWGCSPLPLPSGDSRHLGRCSPAVPGWLAQRHVSAAKEVCRETGGVYDSS